MGTATDPMGYAAYDEDDAERAFEEYVRLRRDLMRQAAASPVGSVVVDPNDPEAIEALIRGAGFVEEMLYRLDPGSATERTVSKADLLNLAKDLERAYQRLGGGKQNIVKPGTVEQVKAAVASVASALRRIVG